VIIMPMVGADLTELSQLVTRLAGQDRGELTAALDKMNATVQDSAEWWIGEHADRFRRDFSVFVTTMHRGLDQVLGQAAQVTRQNLGAIASATGEGPGQQASAHDTGMLAFSANSTFAANGSSPEDTGGVPELTPAAYAGFHTSMQAWFRSATGLWASPEKLHDHAWGGPTRPNGPPHAPDFGSSSDQEYAKQAFQFFQDALPKGYEVKVAGLTLRVYDPKTNIFGSYGADGTVKTFFKPTNPNYWFTQPGSSPSGGNLDAAVNNAAQRVDDASSWFSRVGRAMDTPAGRLGGKALGVLAVAGDVFTIADPSPEALGGPTTERIAAAANLGAMAVTAGPVAGLLAANAALDWVPVAGEVIMAATAAYFVGDLIYQNRQEIGHALSWTGHEAVHVASDVGHGLASGASHAWHSIFG
jgi:uncharacterized protein YukE